MNEKQINTREFYYGVALSLIPKIGNISAKTLLSYCGSFEDIFKAKPAKLKKIPGIGAQLIQNILDFDDFAAVDYELRYIDDKDVRVYFYTSDDYPHRFSPFPESPFILYCRGNADLNAARTLGIVGTRTPTEYGREWTREMISQLGSEGVSIISGFAYGIDITAHMAAIQAGLPTVAVLAGGLDKIYPASHHHYHSDILQNGAFISENPCRMIPDKKRFPMRNRLIAALSDGVLVVESARKGGSMITADIAFAYNKSLMAVPGWPGATFHQGCNHLIKTQKAALVENYQDILELMNWDIRQENVVTQTELFRELSAQEAELLGILRQRKDMDIDELKRQMNIRSNELASLLLMLDLDGFLTQLPGNRIMIR